MENVYWKELLLLVAVWVIILALQIAKVYISISMWLISLKAYDFAFALSLCIKNWIHGKLVCCWQNYTTTCSAEYWVLNLLQVPSMPFITRKH